MAMAKAFATAIRSLRRAPAFSGLVVLTLALGIGATTAMFSVVDAVLITPIPFPNADRMSEIWLRYEEGASRARQPLEPSSRHCASRPSCSTRLPAINSGRAH
jgi:hypothetical protein